MITRRLLIATVAALSLIALPLSASWADKTADHAKQKVKVLYHVDGKDPDVAKYALALIRKGLTDPLPYVRQWTQFAVDAIQLRVRP